MMISLAILIVPIALGVLRAMGVGWSLCLNVGGWHECDMIGFYIKVYYFWHRGVLILFFFFDEKFS